MREDTILRKKTTNGFRSVSDKDWWAGKMRRIVVEGKRAFDSIHLELGRMLAESIMYMEREEMAGPDYQPNSPEVYKWASQGGSIYMGDQKMAVEHPRLRGPKGEIPLPTYEKLKHEGSFSEELLAKALRGISARKYAETVIDAAKALGVSASSVSRHIVEVTSQKLREFKERALGDFQAFAIFLDTIHRGGVAFIVALGIDFEGKKRVLGFWEGATENHEICEELLADLERRGLILSKRILFVTDGGKGIIKALQDRFGKKLIHQRCAIHKGRNIQKHLAKRYRQEARRQFTAALEQASYDDAKKMLDDMEKWLRKINPSAADSLQEALEEILTIHRLQVPALLRKTLYTTNPIESMFSMVRDCESNIKRYRKGGMGQRWLAAVALHCEARFKKVKGFAEIAAVVAAIDREQEETVELKKAA